VARLVFLRHAHSIANESGILSGQLHGITLSKRGKEQAQHLVERLGKCAFDSIRVSPMQRCEETISPWLNSSYANGLKGYEIDESLIEVDYGSWSGKKLSRLSREKLWKAIQEKPSTVQFPDGERIKSMQRRAMASVERALAEKKNGTHLFVSHGDVLKAVIASLLKMRLDDFQSLIIDPASISIVDYDGRKARLLAFNDSSSHIAPLTKMEKTSKALLGGGARKLRKGNK
jgi:probable phosphomutase (TIGR03848 family)